MNEGDRQLDVKRARERGREREEAKESVKYYGGIQIQLDDGSCLYMPNRQV